MLMPNAQLSLQKLKIGCNIGKHQHGRMILQTLAAITLMFMNDNSDVNAVPPLLPYKLPQSLEMTGAECRWMVAGVSVGERRQRLRLNI